MYILTIQHLDNTFDCDLTDRKKKVDHLLTEIIDEQNKFDEKFVSKKEI